MVFTIRAASYIDVGIEAIHFGQVEIMNRNDRDLASWSQVLALFGHMRPNVHASHVLCDGHVPQRGPASKTENSCSIFIPSRSASWKSRTSPPSDLKLASRTHFMDAAKAPPFSGWQCDHLPYLVRIDNSAPAANPEKQGPAASGSGATTNHLVRAAERRISKSVAALRLGMGGRRSGGHLQMPGRPHVASPLDGKRWYYANTKSARDARGSIRKTIRQIWAADKE